MINVYISKSDTSLAVDWDAMPDSAKAHVIEYGLRQKLNDAGSQFTKKELGDEAKALALGAAENVLEALMRGEVTVRQAASQLTLEEREEQKLLISIFKQLFSRKPDKDTDLKAKIAMAKNVSVADLNLAISPVVARRAEARRKEQALRAEIRSIEVEF